MSPTSNIVLSKIYNVDASYICRIKKGAEGNGILLIGGPLKF